MTCNKHHLLRARKSALAIALSFCFASAVQAQSSEGSIFGQATAKAKITITSLDNGSSRQIEAHTDGTFSISKVAPGKYKISSGGVEREIEVVIGTGSETKRELNPAVQVSFNL